MDEASLVFQITVVGFTVVISALFLLYLLLLVFNKVLITDYGTGTEGSEQDKNLKQEDSKKITAVCIASVQVYLKNHEY